MLFCSDNSFKCSELFSQKMNLEWRNLAQIAATSFSSHLTKRDEKDIANSWK